LGIRIFFLEKNHNISSVELLTNCAVIFCYINNC
jgi:hypothetical protein